MIVIQGATIIGGIGFTISTIIFLANPDGYHSFTWWGSLIGMIWFGVFGLWCGITWLITYLHDRGKIY